MSDDRVREILRKTTLFAGFTDEQLEVVPKVARIRDYGAGEVIVREGDEAARSMWLLLEGEVEVRVGGEPIGSLGAGNYFGEMALLADTTRAADVVAVGGVKALELSRSHLRGLIHSDPEVAMAILAELSFRLRRLTDTVAEILSASPEAAAAARDRGLRQRADAVLRQVGPIDALHQTGEE